MDSARLAPLHIVLLAGGKGLRAATAASDTPKQFRNTARGPLYLVCLQEFLKLQSNPDIPVASLTITVPDRWQKEVAQHLQDLENSSSGLSLNVPWFLASAGSTRTESTWSAICSLRDGRISPAASDLVAVHDAARPFASSDLLARLSLAALSGKGAVPGIPVPDSLVQVSNLISGPSQACEYIERSTIFAVQTPQVFQWQALLAAHTWAALNSENFTDDGSLVAHCGTTPQVVSGETGNWKITTAEDSDRAVEILAKANRRK